MATPYQNIAKSALINWNGLSVEEAEKKIQTETVQELEQQVYAMGSVKYAVVGIGKQLNLSEEEAVSLFDVAVNGPENAEIFAVVTEKAKGFTDQQKLGVLSTIHDGWVVDNSSEKTFNKKVSRNQLRQYAPLELIGWNEVKSDLLFLNPILAAIGVNVDEQSLESEYHSMVASYLEENQINSPNDLTDLVSQGRNYYRALSSNDLDKRLAPMSEIVSSQIIENWDAKDPETAAIFNERQRTRH